ncbi:MAG TPA: choice-of-anchor Q domain-containing protein [Vicinamibacterales bacterium]|nr:choice-of-anchor Q domain-containing protein [Vicinamibacterales bacterium]
MHPRTNYRVALLGLSALLAAPMTFAASVNTVPPLPPPSGTVVNVSTEAQLRSAVSALKSNTTIVLAAGTYNLSDALWIDGSYTNIGIRGATNNRDDVVLAGKGMSNAAVPYGIWTGGDVNGITIANLTIRDVYYHCINFNAGTQTPRVYNVHLINAGEQFLKSNPDNNGGGVDNGRVEYSIIEYASTSPSTYTNGVDVHTGANWVVANNLFRNIRATGGLAGPAVLMWNHSTNSTVEGNTFINCQREISLGLENVSPYDQQGGVARNNFIYRAAGTNGDAAIFLGASPNSQVLNNTIYISGDYPSPIEYRFSASKGELLENNLLDGQVLARDGASGTARNNVTNATSGLFAGAASGDLHLVSSASSAIDKGTSTGAPATDWDGQARPYGSAVDVGADEYEPSTTAKPPAPPTNVRIIG